jgi:hypothetical protein
MRTLATVQKVKTVSPIEGKDRIRYISFYGTDWKVIADASVKEDDLVVYCETDSVLPVREEFEFLRKRCYVESLKGFRIKCMKMAGVFSEGIVFPLSILPQADWKEGDNVTTVLKVTKYDDYDTEEPVVKRSKFKSFLYKFAILRFFFRLFGVKKANRGWPSFLAKTDETRVQVLSYVYEKLKGVPVYTTIKMDGQSASYAYYKNEFYICSRNVVLERTKRALVDKGKYHQNAIQNNLQAILKKHHKATGEWLAIQGEQCGPGIQGNKIGLPSLELYVFNIYSITEKRYYGYKELVDFCYDNNLLPVPLTDISVFDYTNVDELLTLAKGNYPNGTPREGVVIRPINPMPAEKGMANMCSFKVINPDFSLKYGV